MTTQADIDDGPCLALVCENASRAQAMLAGTAIARAADAMSRARGVRARTERLNLVAPDRDVWVSITSAHGVPAAEHGVLHRLGTLAIEAAEALSTPLPHPRAIVRLEPLARSPDGPWPGILAAGNGLFGMTESEVRTFLAGVRDRLVAHCPGVRTWLPASGARESTVAVRAPGGLPALPLTFAPFVVTDPQTLAELETVGLPDAALPRPVYRVNEYQP